MPLSQASLLAQTIDDHIAWLTAWTRVACFETHSHAMQSDSLPKPESFMQWRKEALDILQDQPAIRQLAESYEQLHRMARMALQKTPEGSTVARGDYVAVTMKFQEFVDGLRRVERALAAAESGLDNLTGLRSRSGMQNDLTREMSRFKRNNKPFCVALVDIDYFKKINDTYGHDCGDRVLIAVANFITKSLRPFDDVWRWGGEEFLVCVKEADLVNGAIALERVRSGLEKHNVHLGDGRTIKITASFGITAAIKETNIDELVKTADTALYRAKQEGRNRVEAISIEPPEARGPTT